LGPHYWTKHAKPLDEMRVALITTAGIHFHDDKSFEFADASFRPIPGEEDSSNLIMSHSSANFDRIGFVEDVNLVFPIDRFKELANAGTIGSLASLHYSFMGAGLMPEAYEKTTDQAARLLKQDQVDAVFLTPV
tara:strand:- start:105 stop:506 length:402 start_codon:yes stop_codon:yes gene_type:complete